jgi:hypothetical protein
MGVPDFNDSLDDELLIDSMESFRDGVYTGLEASSILRDQASDLVNVDIENEADAVTRKGATTLGSAIVADTAIQGLGEFDITSTETLLAVCNNALYSTSDNSTWNTVSGYTATSGANVEFVQLGGKVFIMDGTQAMHSYQSGTVISEGTGGNNAPIAAFGIAHLGQLIVGGNPSVRDLLAASYSGNGSGGNWSTSERQIQVGEEDGDSLKALCTWYGTLFVAAKEYSLYVIDGSPLEKNMAMWQVETISDTIGCVAHRTMKKFGNDVLFLSQDGVRSLVLTKEGGKDRLSKPLSWPMQSIIDRINWTHAHKSCAIAFDNRYMIALPIDSATSPNYVLVYNERIGQWTGYWTGWTPRVFLHSKLSNRKRCLFGQNDGKVRKWNFDASTASTSSYQDDSTDIATTIIGRNFNFGSKLNLKTGWNVDFLFPSSRADANAYAILNDGGEQAIETGFETQDITNTLPVNLPFNLHVPGNKPKAFDTMKFGQFRDIKYKLTSSSDRLAVRRIFSTAYLDSLEYEK